MSIMVFACKLADVSDVVGVDSLADHAKTLGAVEHDLAECRVRVAEAPVGKTVAGFF